jgi:salicylate hydroxylase
MKVLISGGGIGGLTAALCCLHYGHEVIVFEQAAEIGEVGAGIQIPPNAMKVFETLGLSDAIARRAFRPGAIETRMGESGAPIFTIPLAEQAEVRWGAPYLHIHRADYIDVLKQALKKAAPQSLHLGAVVKGYQQAEDGISISLSDGSDVSGDILIGADGIKSAVRAQMLGADKPIFTGNLAWRAVVPAEALGEHKPNPTACAWMGRGRHCVTYYLRGGELVNFVGVVEREDWTEEGWAISGRPEDALKDFGHWYPVIKTILKAADPEQLFKWALFDRKPLRRWVDGRAALLGDAAHPMLPFLAQGAAMAVEDAWVLAREISNSERQISESLAAYQAKRLPRCSKVQAASRANMKTFHQRTKLGQIKTYGPMWLAGKLAPSAVHKRMDWIYGMDVTKP